MRSIIPRNQTRKTLYIKHLQNPSNYLHQNLPVSNSSKNEAELVSFVLFKICHRLKNTADINSRPTILNSITPNVLLNDRYIQQSPINGIRQIKMQG